MIALRPSRAEDGARLVAIWRAAVDATHDFLGAEDRDAIAEEVAAFLPHVPAWLAVDADDCAVAFVGVRSGMMEALFVHPDRHGRGVGRALVTQAMKGNALLTTAVNEQNEGARRFYERLGFVRTGRSERDDQGRPYSLLHLEISDEDWHSGLDIYFLNVVRAVRLIAPIMVSQKRGSIVNISTAWVSEPSALFPTSAVARAGLGVFTKLFADEHGDANVRMNNVLPGWIDSIAETDERRSSVPMKRYGTADEIASVVAFLASEGAGYITGQNIRVDGGLMRSVG